MQTNGRSLNATQHPRAMALLTSRRPHRGIEELLGRDELIDRTTLYRVRDWLAACGLADKLASADRPQSGG
jgi:hypothetical protein